MERRTEIADALERFLRESFQIPEDDAYFSRKLNLWEEGYVDSPGVLEVLGWLEARFGAEIPHEALFEPEFTSVDGIARVVASLLPPS